MAASGLHARLTLGDGARLALRPARARDAAAEQAFFRGLSLASRQLRFHIAIRELPPDLLRALTDVDQRRHVAAVAEAMGCDGRPQIVADARYVRTARTGEAEFALTVADAWQGRGLGRELLRRLRRHARAQGLQLLHGDVLHANAPMMALLRSLGAGFVALPGDATVVRAQLRLDGDA